MVKIVLRGKWFLVFGCNHESDETNDVSGRGNDGGIWWLAGWRMWFVVLVVAKGVVAMQIWKTFSASKNSKHFPLKSTHFRRARETCSSDYHFLFAPKTRKYDNRFLPKPTEH